MPAQRTAALLLRQVTAPPPLHPPCLVFSHPVADVLMEVEHSRCTGIFPNNELPLCLSGNILPAAHVLLPQRYTPIRNLKCSIPPMAGPLCPLAAAVAAATTA